MLDPLHRRKTDAKFNYKINMSFIKSLGINFSDRF